MNSVTEELIASLVAELKVLKQQISKLESNQHLPAKPTAPFPPAHSRSSSRKGQLAAPTSTPIITTPLAALNISSLSSKADFEKAVVTVSVPDTQTGHIVGRAGAGLSQIHEFSHAKISVAPPTDSSGLRSITIRGSAREVGDALLAIGKRMARRRIRKPKPKKKELASPPVALCSPSPPLLKLQPPSDLEKITPHISEKGPTPEVKIPSCPPPLVKLPSSITPQPQLASKPLTPMDVDSHLSPSTPLSQSLSPGSPMQVDTLRSYSSVASDRYSCPGPVQPRKGLQTARRGGGPPVPGRRLWSLGQ